MRIQDKTIYLHPYFLKEWQRYWYIFGWNDAEKKIRNYELDRIVSVKKASGYLFRPPEMNFNTYFDDIVGVTRIDNQPLQLYRIQVSKEIAPYWQNRPLHLSQTRVAETTEGVIFEFKLRWNYEWQNLILYYGRNVVVLEPIEFRNNIQQILKETLALYSERL
jgi:predicted DNA-binding transcriptional regulator YafY